MITFLDISDFNVGDLVISYSKIIYEVLEIKTIVVVKKTKSKKTKSKKSKSKNVHDTKLVKVSCLKNIETGKIQEATHGNNKIFSLYKI